MARRPSMTVALHLYDAAGRHLATIQRPVGLTPDGLVFSDARIPGEVTTPDGNRRVAAFALYPQGHERHQLVPLPRE